MQIKDLDLSRELTAEEQAAVAGGDNLSAINSPTAAILSPTSASGSAGVSFASPVIAVGSTNVQNVTDNDVKVDLDTNTVTNNLVGSLANIAQFVK